MTDHDQLLARAEAQRDAWKEKCHKAWDDVDKQANRAISAEFENQRLRVALATQPQPGVPTALDMVTDLHCAIYGDTWARPETPAEVWEMLLEEVRVFVAKAVAGSATPTTENDDG
jgi:hypothetical protein